MSGFSDASIKFLKKDMRRWCKEERQMMEGLLLRLDAAEKVAECESLCDKHADLAKVWLLSKGGAGK